MESEYIFVYGSLRRDFPSSARGVLDDYAEYVGEATFRGRLYEIDWYPGVVPSRDENDVVYGEVYKMADSKKVLSKLDRYEGCSALDPKPHAFVRRQMGIMLENGREIKAWIYLYEWPVDDKEQIPSGDYLNSKK